MHSRVRKFSYRSYVIEVKARRGSRKIHWVARVRVLGKLGVAHRVDTKPCEELLHAEELGLLVGCRFVDALADEVPLGAYSAQWSLPIG